ncbi:outer membrane lipoprotein-sorting protein [Pseudoduganella sp. OTU4001]|uniref:outer membrane lipoprotein-sorting protein n=1 Tax=Pseudoduganella sp. OTU4001 TaxID=3043854 RepID=UPI00313EA7B1
MKKWIISAAALAAAAAHADDSAHAAIAKAWQQYRSGVESEQELVEVQVIQAGQAQPNKMVWRRVRYGEQGQRLAIKFVQPAADLGLGLLVERNANGGDQVWLRQPSWTSARRIAGNRENKYFADTAFTFEDTKQLIAEPTSQFDYRYISQGAAGSMVAATPKPGTASGYARRDIALNAQGVPLRIDYFDAGGKLLKTLSFEELEFPAPGRWRANRIVMTLALDASRSTLIVHKRQFNIPLAEQMFSVQNLLETESANSK